MSVANDILEELARRGVAIRVDGDTLRLKPKAAVDDGLLARLQAHKPDILAVFSASPATCSSTCYEIEPGVCIHHPWDGCKTCPTPQREKPTRKVESVCWHCGGNGECSCFTCGHFEAHAVWTASRCVPCRLRECRRAR
jgi:hypothetical protein